MVEFVDTENELPETLDIGYDETQGRYYIYHAIHASETSPTLRIRDVHTNLEYLINLENGAVTKIDE